MSKTKRSFLLASIALTFVVWAIVLVDRGRGQEEATAQPTPVATIVPTKEPAPEATASATPKVEIGTESGVLLPKDLMEK